jgi:hypothetical protein
MKDLIPLQTAFIQQRKTYKDNSWVVFDTDGNELFALDGALEPKTAMSYLHFARPFELEALNIGIEYGKKLAETGYIVRAETAETRARLLADENERLSMKLLQVIESGSD